ncbi:MAG: hypothetical protein RLZZ387_2648 [Chloroflexota bacterium]|jgi:hypothetical protein
MHTTSSDDLAELIARGRARIAELSAEMARLTERLAALRAERTQLTLEVTHAELVLDWRARAGVALGDVFADLDDVDFTLSTLTRVAISGDLLLLTVQLRDGGHVRVAFAGAPTDTDLEYLRAYAARRAECSGIVLDGDGYRLLLIDGDALLVEGCLLAGELLAVQFLREGDDAATA